MKTLSPVALSVLGAFALLTTGCATEYRTVSTVPTYSGTTLPAASRVALVMEFRGGEPTPQERAEVRALLADYLSSRGSVLVDEPRDADYLVHAVLERRNPENPAEWTVVNTYSAHSLSAVGGDYYRWPGGIIEDDFYETTTFTYIGFGAFFPIWFDAWDSPWHRGHVRVCPPPRRHNSYGDLRWREDRRQHRPDRWQRDRHPDWGRGDASRSDHTPARPHVGDRDRNDGRRPDVNRGDDRRPEVARPSDRRDRHDWSRDRDHDRGGNPPRVDRPTTVVRPPVPAAPAGPSRPPRPATPSEHHRDHSRVVAPPPQPSVPPAPSANPPAPRPHVNVIPGHGAVVTRPPVAPVERNEAPKVQPAPRPTEVPHSMRQGRERVRENERQMQQPPSPRVERPRVQEPSRNEIRREDRRHDGPRHDPPPRRDDSDRSRSGGERGPAPQPKDDSNENQSDQHRPRH